MRTVTPYKCIKIKVKWPPKVVVGEQASHQSVHFLCKNKRNKGRYIKVAEAQAC